MGASAIGYQLSSTGKANLSTLFLVVITISVTVRASGVATSVVTPGVLFSCLSEGLPLLNLQDWSTTKIWMGKGKTMR